MTGKPERNNRCPLCGGHMEHGRATIPFVLPDLVVVVKDVPAEICSSCHEPYTVGKVTDRITYLLSQARSLHTEVSVIHYSTSQAIRSPSLAVAET
jgi:YgiT-type zinc finger domain-containing protein